VNKLSFCLMLALVASLVAGPPAHAELADTPWPMFRHDLQHTGWSEYAGPSNPVFAWSYETGNDLYYSSPALGTDGRVYVGSYDNKLYAIAPDGALSWIYEAGGDVLSSPALGSDGLVYVGSYDNKLYAIAPDGALEWSYETNGYVYSSPALGSDGRVYFGSHDYRIYAIASDRALEWSYATGYNVAHSSPALGSDGQVYVGSYDNRLYAVASDGALSWSYETVGNVYSSPALGSDGRVYVGSLDNSLYAIASDGSLSWSYVTGGSFYPSSPALGSDGRVYVGSADNRLYCIKQVPTETPTITPTSAPTKTPTTTPTPPIDLTADKTEYGTTGAISVTADVWPLTVPCYPFVRILMADGSTLYYQSGVGFTASPVPYLGFEAGTIVTTEPIRDYLVLSASFSGIATGTYYLEGGAVDMTKTVSADNLIYFGAVDRETLKVK